MKALVVLRSRCSVKAIAEFEAGKGYKCGSVAELMAVLMRTIDWAKAFKKDYKRVTDSMLLWVFCRLSPAGNPDMQRNVAFRQRLCWQARRNAAHVRPAEVSQPGCRLKAKPGQLGERGEEYGRTGLVEVEFPSGEHQGKYGAGHRPLRARQTATLRCGGFAAAGVHIGCIWTVQVKIVPQIRVYLLGQKRHVKRLVGILLTAAIAAIAAITVLQPVVAPAQGSAARETRPPDVKIAPKMVLHVALPHTGLLAPVAPIAVGDVFVCYLVVSAYTGVRPLSMPLCRQRQDRRI